MYKIYVKYVLIKYVWFIIFFDFVVVNIYNNGMREF